MMQIIIYQPTTFSADHTKQNIYIPFIIILTLLLEDSSRLAAVFDRW
jgi:hypothetical protein